MTADKRRFNDSGDRRPEVAEPPKAPQVEFAIEAINNWVLIKKITREERRTDAGVIVVAGGKSSRGVVVSAAAGVPLNQGDIVIFTNFPIDLDDLEELTGDKNLKLVRYEEVYARVKILKEDLIKEQADVPAA